MKKTLLLALLLSGVCFAQDTSFLKTFCQTRGFLLGRPQKPWLTPDGKTVLYLRSEAQSRVQSLYSFDVASKKETLLLSPQDVLGANPEKISAEEKARRERMRLQTAGFSEFWLDGTGTRVICPLSGKLYLLNLKSGQVLLLNTGPGVIDPRWADDDHHVAYVRDFDVYVYDTATGKETAVTHGGTAQKSHGVAEFVAQEEMGRLHGYFWSPDSKFIAYEEADPTPVEVWNIADPSKPDAKPQQQYYPRPGHPNVSVRLGIVPIAGGKTVWVDWDRKAYEYLGSVRWDSKGPLCIQLQDRKQQHLALFQVEAATGKTRKILEQRDPRWVNLRQHVPVWLAGGKQFLMPLEGNGRENLCLVNATDASSRTLIPDGLELVDFEGYDSKRRRVYCRVEDGPPGNPRELCLELGEDGTPHEVPISGEHGAIDLVVAKDGTTLVTTQSIDSLPRTRVVSPSGETLAELPSVALNPDIKLNFVHEPLRDAAGKLVLNAAMVRPRAFDPKLKYPVVLSVYGGPHHLVVTQAERDWLVDQWLADQGFIVVSIDNRGTPGRGLEWEKGVYGHFDTVPMEDQVKGLTELGRLHPELDLKRVGSVGWSFGGYMSALAVIKYPQVFAAAVAGAPVTDWMDYDTHYTERYLGVPPEAEQAYTDGSLLKAAEKLDRPLLLVHGTADDNVYFRHSLRLCDALSRAGRPFEMLPLPGITHAYTADAQVTERLWARVADFFHAHLGRPQG